MKIKVKAADYRHVSHLASAPHRLPRRQSFAARLLLKAVSLPDLKATDFHCESVGMEKLGKNEPALFLMNHSSFIDLKIASSVLFPRSFHIVCTSDGFVGKEGLMRWLGCIPTRKFITDTTLVRDMVYTLHTLNSSVLLYPEASYSFDGTATPLPDSLGKCLKLLKVPVVMITTFGAFARDPLYNMLQNRKVRVSARMEYLLSPEDIAAKNAGELNEILKKQFSFDHFRWQRENQVCIAEPFRADGLQRVLYKCPVCLTEGSMKGQGISLRCEHCGKGWQLDEYGALQADEGEVFFDHIPDWYTWERQEVRRELEEKSYRLDVPVSIRIMKNMRQIYEVGDGRLVHDENGFQLTGCGGQLDYRHLPSQSYSLYADYYWYELGDMICIGNTEALYYCFPAEGSCSVAKARLAAEELFKMKRAAR